MATVSLSSFEKRDVGYFWEVADFISGEQLSSGDFQPAIPVTRVSSEGIWALPAAQHTAVLARTGSGKTESMICPSLSLAALSKEKPNILCIDAKTTSRDKTMATFEKQGYEVFNLDLGSEFDDTDTWNPLAKVQEAYQADDEGMYNASWKPVLDSLEEGIEDKTSRYWGTQMRTLVKDVFEGLYERTGGAEVNLRDVYDIVLGGKDEMKKLAKEGGDALWAKSLMGIAKLPEDATLACVLQQTASAFRGFCEFGLDKASRSSTFSAKKFAESDKPVCVYLICPENIEGVHVYAALLINSVIQELLHAADTKRIAIERATHFYIDEFGLIPKTWISKVIASARSRSLYFHLSFQSMSQLAAGVYTQPEAKVLVQQMGAVMLMASNDTDAIELEHLFCPAVTPALIGSLSKGVAIVHQYGKPVFRAELSQQVEYVEAGLFEEEKVFKPRSKPKPFSVKSRSLAEKPTANSEEQGFAKETESASEEDSDFILAEFVESIDRAIGEDDSNVRADQESEAVPAGLAELETGERNRDRERHQQAFIQKLKRALRHVDKETYIGELLIKSAFAYLDNVPLADRESVLEEALDILLEERIEAKRAIAYKLLLDKLMDTARKAGSMDTIEVFVWRLLAEVAEYLENEQVSEEPLRLPSGDIGGLVEEQAILAELISGFFESLDVLSLEFSRIVGFNGFKESCEKVVSAKTKRLFEAWSAAVETDTLEKILCSGNAVSSSDVFSAKKTDRGVALAFRLARDVVLSFRFWLPEEYRERFEAFN